MIYVASKVRHAARWRALRSIGVRINSTWIDEARAGESPSLPDLWRRRIVEAATARAVLVYAEPGEVLKGALVEVGASLAAGNRVYAVGVTKAEHGSWVEHPSVTVCGSIEEALKLINPKWEGGGASTHS